MRKLMNNNCTNRFICVISLAKTSFSGFNLMGRGIFGLGGGGGREARDKGVRTSTGSDTWTSLCTVIGGVGNATSGWSTSI